MTSDVTNRMTGNAYRLAARWSSGSPFAMIYDRWLNAHC